jgi:hypothetical protein
VKNKRLNEPKSVFNAIRTKLKYSANCSKLNWGFVVRGVNVMITNFCNFCRFSVEKIGVFLNNAIIQSLPNLAVLCVPKRSFTHFFYFFNHNIRPHLTRNTCGKDRPHCGPLPTYQFKKELTTTQMMEARRLVFYLLSFNQLY